MGPQSARGVSHRTGAHHKVAAWHFKSRAGMRAQRTRVTSTSREPSSVCGGGSIQTECQAVAGMLGVKSGVIPADVVRAVRISSRSGALRLHAMSLATGCKRTKTTEPPRRKTSVKVPQLRKEQSALRHERRIEDRMYLGEQVPYPGSGKVRRLPKAPLLKHEPVTGGVRILYTQQESALVAEGLERL